MELHLALRKIIDSDGVDIVNNVRLVNILSDMKAFDTTPATKYILKAIIADGYANKLYSIGCWGSKSDALYSHFVISTGFQKEYVYFVFQSLAYGFGWINSFIDNNNLSFVPKQLSSNSIISSERRVLRTREQKELFLLGKIEFINDIKALTGIEVSNFSFDVQDNKTFSFNCEIKGHLLETCKTAFYIKLVIYDDKNKIRFNSDLGYYFQSDNYYKGFYVAHKYIQLPCLIKNVGRICIFAQ